MVDKIAKVLIIGTGFLGTAIVRKMGAFGHDVSHTYRTNCSFIDSMQYDFFSDDAGKVIDKAEPEIIIMPLKIEFTENRNLLEKKMIEFLKNAVNSRMVYISSDGIFDGKKGLYKESDIPTPVTDYGRNLKLCEDLVGEYSDNYCIIRPSYLYGYLTTRILDNRLRPVFESLKKGRLVKKFTDMYKSPLEVNSAAIAISQVALTDYKGVLHVAGSRLSVYEFFYLAMKRLKVPTEKLKGIKMPKNRPAESLPDTSLNNDLLKKILDIDIPEVVETL